MTDRFRLNRQHSTLDLIDSSTLTSLPFPPPMKTSDLKHKRSRYDSLNRSKSSMIFEDRSRIKSPSPGFGTGSTSSILPTTHASHNLNHQVLKDLPMEEVSFTSIDTLTTPNMTTEIDESFNEDAEEPIIFVEDYMEPQQRQNPSKSILRQKSLANFKERVSGDLKKRKFSDNPPQKENLEEIFGSIPGKSLLKHCEICDKPLYEISSIINNKRARYDSRKYGTNSSISAASMKPNKNAYLANDDYDPSMNNRSGPDAADTDSSVTADTAKLNDVFNEFICVECIDLYEEFLNELYAEEIATERSNSFNLPESKNLKLLNIFKTIQLRSNNRTPQFHSAISNNLISRLQFLNSNSLSNELVELNDMNWLKTLQNKLRWRWRLNGLMPSMRKKD